MSRSFRRNASTRLFAKAHIAVRPDVSTSQRRLHPAVSDLYELDMTRKHIVIVTTTVMWVLTAALLLFVLNGLIGWPVTLTILFLAPIILLWVPAGYAFIIASDNAYSRSGAISVSLVAVAKWAILGLLTGALILSALFAEASWRSDLVVALITCVLIGVGCIVAFTFATRSAIEDLRRGSVNGD